MFRIAATLVFVLLALFAWSGAATAQKTTPNSTSAVLWDQYNNSSSNSATVSRDAPNSIYDMWAADDFVITGGGLKSLEQIDVHGEYLSYPVAQSVTVRFFHNNNDRPGELIAGRANIVLPQAQLDSGDFQIPINPPVVLGAGHYWVSVNANSASFWTWFDRSVMTGFPAAFQAHPENEFYEQCQAPAWYRRMLDCGYGSGFPDQVFRILGNDYVPPTATLTPAPTNTPEPPTATPTLTPIPPTPTVGPGCLYSDVCPPDYWFSPVEYLRERGAISGYNDNTFRPHNFATRGQVAKIVVSAEGWPIVTTGGPHFSDVLVSNGFYGFIETAYNNGIIAGYADGTFRPNNNITRGQLAKVIVIAEGWSLTSNELDTFVDVGTDNPFYAYIETAVARGIISGYALPNGQFEFRWHSNATRAQISKIVYLAVTSTE